MKSRVLVLILVVNFSTGQGAVKSQSESAEVRLESTTQYFAKTYSKNKFSGNQFLITDSDFENESLGVFSSEPSSTAKHDNVRPQSNSNFLNDPEQTTAIRTKVISNDITANGILQIASTLDGMTPDFTKTFDESSSQFIVAEVSATSFDPPSSTTDLFFPKTDGFNSAPYTAETMDQEFIFTEKLDSTSDHSSVASPTTSSSVTDPFSSTLEHANEFDKTTENLSSTSEVSWESSSSEFYKQPDLSVVLQERSDIIEMTLKYHQMRVKLATQSNAIANQEKFITKLTQTIADLRHDVAKLEDTHRHEMTILHETNGACQNDFKTLMAEIKVARKLFAMEKYSVGMRQKLAEFGIDEKTKINVNSTSIKFSVFKIESDDFLGQILSNRQLQILPPRIGDIVGNVSELSAAGVGLLAINKNAFEEMTQLKLLNLSMNEVTEIEKETFMNLIELEILDLSRNAINTIDVASFSGLNELESLDLSVNNISVVIDGTFDTLLNLKILNLSFNQITELKHELFTVINVIEEFYINNNKLEVVNPVIVSDFETAKIIDFQKNVCIDTRFPEKLTMTQVLLEVVEKCKKDLVT